MQVHEWFFAAAPGHPAVQHMNNLLLTAHQQSDSDAHVSAAELRSVVRADWTQAVLRAWSTQTSNVRHVPSARMALALCAEPVYYSH